MVRKLLGNRSVGPSPRAEAVSRPGAETGDHP